MPGAGWLPWFPSRVGTTGTAGAGVRGAAVRAGAGVVPPAVGVAPIGVVPVRALRVSGAFVAFGAGAAVGGVAPPR